VKVKENSFQLSASSWKVLIGTPFPFLAKKGKGFFSVFRISI